MIKPHEPPDAVSLLSAAIVSIVESVPPHALLSHLAAPDDHPGRFTGVHHDLAVLGGAILVLRRRLHSLGKESPLDRSSGSFE